MNIPTFATMVVLALVVTTIVRFFAGWTLAGWLLTFVLALLGAVGGWYAEQQLALPSFFALTLPNNQGVVSVVWAILGAISLTVLGALIARPGRSAPPRRYGSSRRR